jgi:CubicO group peptidase (beta-lactamase class C family)
MMLNGGELDGVRVFKPETLKLMTSVHSPDAVLSRRGLGWDIDSPFSRPRGGVFPRGSYGHTGWTGTAIWIDPFSKTFWIFLSNRVHPNGKGNVLPLYLTLGTLAAKAVDGFEFGARTASIPRELYRGRRRYERDCEDEQPLRAASGVARRAQWHRRAGETKLRAAEEEAHRPRDESHRPGPLAQRDY